MTGADKVNVCILAHKNEHLYVESKRDAKVKGACNFGVTIIAIQRDGEYIVIGPRVHENEPEFTNTTDRIRVSRRFS